ncbi:MULTISPECIES: TIGR03067 domain-containing protein [Pseudomonas]|uniref:TIGR03067 domain-containing protein n=1 Tax=Pseudomonas protegens TaxID=380021 RepID=A0A9Q6IKD4_9PSED|nr:MULTISPECIES: TIGR03067 domain-containing protein [Pseudomonas]AXK51846.1 TIGR03067 domain-containing protein [Pseudomonas protegens]MCL9657321.1 TIGR03067 domain-containing protein [Pseudomonas protegens]MCO7577456.1 TIGR03067 domain-containing protein [Pseudomonas protegens]MCO7583828.1 TIGR03067 domain-containing protein [Pseudomonas chlororaphis]MCO7600839.1 TIGR03067 domain-containing protein [Pseudomonas chlororaphis]
MDTASSARSNDSLELQRLQGAWEQISMEDSGVLNPPDEHSAPGALTLIEGDQFRVLTVAGDVLLAGSFTLDSSTTPKSITWIDSIGADAGKPLPASYELTEDDFVFIAADEGQPRPTRFSTGPGQTLRRFVRVRQGQ